MGIGFSLFLIAVGAILAWAVSYTVTGVDVRVVGAILIVIGSIGLVLSLLFWASFAPFADRAPFRSRSRTARDTVVVEPAPVVVREERRP